MHWLNQLIKVFDQIHCLSFTEISIQFFDDIIDEYDSNYYNNTNHSKQFQKLKNNYFN